MPRCRIFCCCKIFCWCRNILKASQPWCTRDASSVVVVSLFPPGPPCPWHSCVSGCYSPPPAVPPPHTTTLLSRLRQFIVVEITGDRLQWQPQMKANLSQHDTPDGQGRGRQPGVTCACCRPCCPFPRSSAGVPKGPPKRQSPRAVPAAQGHGLMGVTEVCLTWCLFPK